MMQKVSGDESSSKEFGEVFGKISETIKDGGNPLEAMGDIIKQVSMHAAEGDETVEGDGGDADEGDGVEASFDEGVVDGEATTSVSEVALGQE
jgi:hypothetical protein